MPTHVIVGCGKQKKDTATQAGDLYESTYFDAKRSYAKAVGSFWYIYSAKHGIIPFGHVIEPYDETASDVEDDVLRDRVASTIDDACGTRWSRVDRVVVLAGRAYVDPVRDIIEDAIDADVAFPFQDLDLGGIGEQMKWCRERATEESNAGLSDYV